MKLRMRQQRMIAIALTIALLASLALGSATGLAVVEQDVLANGNFEGGFHYVPGCGAVANGWDCFNSGGQAAYGMFDDQWKPSVAEGTHSQLMEISTQPFPAPDPNRYIGISQTVAVVKGGNYHLKLQGLMREDHPIAGADPWRYRVQWGYAANGQADWTAVNNWQELPWDNVSNMSAPGPYDGYETVLTAPADKITVFIRLWSKWPVPYQIVGLNLDTISLFGPAVQQPGVVVVPQGPGGQPGGTRPTEAPQGLTCGGGSLIKNGDFERGSVNGVGKNWTAFNNGGKTVFGFYDEMWPRVVHDGAHGQLIEVSTRGNAEGDRYAGIYQVVKGLIPGATYEFSLYGLMREDASLPGDDPYRYQVQWGYAAASGSLSQASITNWQGLPWNTIYDRLDPGAMLPFSARFVAPSNKVVLAIRVWKKWAIAYRELDVNLDSIKLVSCAKQHHGDNDHQPPPPVQCFTYKVKAGDTLYAIAVKYADTVAGLVERNEIANANLIRIGQQLQVCDPK